jgi:hypothetical protein
MPLIDIQAITLGTKGVPRDSARELQRMLEQT